MPEKDRHEESFAEMFEKEGERPVSSGHFKDAAGFTIDVPRPVLNEHAKQVEREDPCWCHSSYGENRMRSDLGEDPEDKIDLHGKKFNEAFEALDAFLARCLARGCAFVEVIHGKGEGVLRKSSRGWLAKCRHVLFYSEVGGNTGSVLVRLRRLDKKK